MADLNVPVYSFKENSNVYIGAKGGVIVGSLKEISSTTTPLIGATLGYEYKDRQNGGLHVGVEAAAGTVVAGKANLGYELRWGDYGLDLSTNVKAAQTLPSTIAKTSLFDLNTGVSGEFVYHGKHGNVAFGAETGYHMSMPTTFPKPKPDNKDDFEYEIHPTDPIIIQSTGNSSENTSTSVKTVTDPGTTAEQVSNNKISHVLISPTLKAEVNLGEGFSMNVDANMYQATLGFRYNFNAK